MMQSMFDMMIFTMFAKFMLNDMAHAFNIIERDPLDESLHANYGFLQKTPRGSVVSVSKDKRFARIEVTGPEDAQDLSVLLNALDIKRKSVHGVSGPAWTGTSYRYRSERGVMSKERGEYPGITYYINYRDLLKAMRAMGMTLNADKEQGQSFPAVQMGQLRPLGNEYVLLSFDGVHELGNVWEISEDPEAIYQTSLDIFGEFGNINKESLLSGNRIYLSDNDYNARYIQVERRPVN